MKRNFLAAATTIIIIVFALTTLILTPEPAAGSVNSPDAEISSAYPEWQLIVTGFVENPLNLSWAEIVALPQSTVNAALVCVDFPDQLVAAGNWTGVKLRLLLETAEISPEAIKVGFYATDGFSTDLTIEIAMRDDIILAYELNGKPLDEVLRLVVPGKWGYKWIHHVDRIELHNYNFIGKWESRGYSDEADAHAQIQPEPSGIIPEFPSILSSVIAMILITLVVAILRKKVAKPNAHIPSAK